MLGINQSGSGEVLCSSGVVFLEEVNQRNNICVDALLKFVHTSKGGLVEYVKYLKPRNLSGQIKFVKILVWLKILKILSTQTSCGCSHSTNGCSERGNMDRCPRAGCNGPLEGPQYENTTQGRVLTIHCLNCGWRANDKVLAIETELVPKVFPKCRPNVIKKMPVHGTKRVFDLSRYEFEPERAVNEQL